MEIDKAITLLSQLGFDSLIEKTGKNEIESLAHAVIDLERAGDKLSKLCSAILSRNFGTKHEIQGLLADLEAELSHILYHVSDSYYLSHVLLPYSDEVTVENTDKK